MRLRIFTVMLAMLTVSGMLSAQNDPFLGTWKLNLAKSKYSPGPPPQSQTIKYEPWGNDGLKYTGEQVNAQGNQTHTGYQAKYDGKDYPFTGTQNYDAIALKRIDAHTIEGPRKKNGKVVDTARRVVSPDGKTLTLTTKGTNAQGQPVNDVAVFDRQ